MNIAITNLPRFASATLNIFNLPKCMNSTPTWMLLHISQIISKEKNFIERSRVTHLSCWTVFIRLSLPLSCTNLLLQIFRQFYYLPGIVPYHISFSNIFKAMSNPFKLIFPTCYVTLLSICLLSKTHYIWNKELNWCNFPSLRIPIIYHMETHQNGRHPPNSYL